MIPPEPPRSPQLGFLYLPPFRVQGYSIAGEETFVQIPELDVCFDLGRARRAMLTSNHVALTHGHMDHAAGLAYYFSQRHFQGMREGTVLCHPKLAGPLQKLMGAWIHVESQHTPYRIMGIEPDGEEFEMKNHYFLRAFETDHTVPSLGFMVIERRTKLKPELVGLPQEKLREMKEGGAEITNMIEVPLIAYMGDTGPGSHFRREDVQAAKIVITECTFLDPTHRDRARVGKHLHLDDLIKVLPNLSAEHVVVTHLSRRLHLGQARERLDQAVPPEHRERVHLLMDGRTNKQRYQQQLAEAEAEEAQMD